MPESINPELLAATARPIAELLTDLHPPLTQHEALVESDRCYFCYDAPCMKACPTSIDIPLFIRKISTGNDDGAAKTIFEQNILGGMCARVCPTETLCEEACVRNTAEDRPVKIGLLQRHATDHYMQSHTTFGTRAAATGKKVAVVGAGPAGLAAAHGLARAGHAVTLFDARPKAGGLNEYGIAAYKAVDDFAAREVEFITSIGGIEIKNGMALGRDITVTGLSSGFDAVFLGLGLGAVNGLNLPNEETAGVSNAVDFIADLRQASSTDQLKVGQSVVVIGGGMTAVDAAVQSKKLGAKQVHLVYRRGPEHMNASTFEQELAATSGVVIRHWAEPKAIVSEGSKTIAVEFEETTIDPAGRLTGTGARFTISADQVLKAIGQTFVPASIADAGLELEKGRIKVDAARKTSLPNVWAGGDCVAGGEDLTVVAVADGRDAAKSINLFLQA